MNAIIAVFNNNPHLKNDLKHLYSSHVSNLSESVNSAGQAVDADVIGPLKKKVIQQITEINQQLKSLNNHLSSSLPSPSASADPAELQSKLAALKKVEELCGFYENLKSASNNPKNLLENLCDGLQTFLGYDKTSKGYDGTGIVYSDLDRLCDAVMGFLSGVLSNIKDHLGQHKDEITSAIEALKTNKHLGKKGFNAAIGKVVDGVRGYNDKVEQSNERIIEVVTKFTEHISALNEKARSNSTHQHVDQINAVLDECLQMTAMYKQGIENEQLDVNDLSQQLKEQIDNATINIEYQAGRLHGIHMKQKEDLTEAERVVQEQFDESKRFINKTTREKVSWFVQKINKKIYNLRAEIESVDTGLVAHVGELQQWMDKAHKAVEEALTKLNDIIAEVNGNGGHQNKGELEKAIGSLQEKALRLYHAYKTTADSTLPDLIKTLTQNVKALDEKIRQDLGRLEKEIKREISDYANKAKEHFKEIQDEIGDRTKDANTVDYNWDMLKAVTKSLLKDIKGTGFNKCGLEQIVDGVADYATDFDAKFQRKIDTMIEKMVNEKEPIKGYVDQNLKDKVKFKEEIQKKIAQLVETVAKKPTEKLGVEKSLSSIASYMQEYAEAVEKGIAETEVQVFVKDIKTKVLKNSFISVGDERLLTRNIQTIFAAVKAGAMRAADELKEFISDSKIKNINSAMDNAQKIAKQFDNRGTSYGEHIDNALTEVKKRIGWLNDALSDDINKNVEEKFKNSHKYNERVRELMATYGTEVDDGAEKRIGTLRHAIDQVEKKALASFDTLKTNADKSNIQRDVANFHKHLNGLCTAILNAAQNGQSVGVKVNQLKQWISLSDYEAKGSLNALHKQLSELQTKHLHPLIGKAYAIISHITLHSDALVVTLGQHVDTTLHNSQNTIIVEMRRRYVRYIKSQVEAFADKVNKELEHLPAQITDDANKCYKGFMKELYDKAVLHLNASSQRTDFLLDFSSDVNIFFSSLFATLDINTTIMPKPVKITELLQSFGLLFTGLTTFNRPFVRNLSSLYVLLDSIRPASYAENSNPLLECLKEGVQRMCEELEKAYVSVYDSETFGAELVEKGKLTPYGTKLSKVFMSILEMYNEDLKYLKNRTIHKWSTSRIYAGSSLGTFLQNSGYGVSNKETEQNGHLDKNVRGEKIMNLLVGSHQCVFNTNKDTKNACQNLYDCLTTYYRVRHISTAGSKKSPCNVYEMLCWLTSLRYSSVYSDFISDDFSDLFDKRETKNAETNDPDFIPVDDLGELSLKACPQRITYGEIHDAIVHVTAVSSTVLTTIVGYGDAYGTYAVDFYSNALRLSYPSSSVDCLNMLIEVLGRLLPVFTFLHGQCSITAKHYGWSNCLYGKGIKWSTSPCDEHSKTELECHAKSPLQSFLRDCLPGYLPHQVESVGCKSDCKTCPKSLPGAPCLTPLGFRGFSGSTKTGKELCNVLTKFMGNGVASPLFSLTPKPPKTLAEHFGFALSLVRNWKRERSYSLKTKMVSTIEAVSIGLCKNADNLTNALSNAYGDNKLGHEGNGHRDGTEADLVSLSTIESCVYPNKNVHCAPYLQSLYSNSYMYVAEKHANAYLSWALYLPWNLHSLLKSLLDAFSNIVCQDWGCSRCAHGSACRRGNHGVDYNCQCRGIIECRGVQSTLYSFGFMFGNSEKLGANERKRYCHNFHKQLRNVLNSQYFIALFKECDNFIWTIREPFTYLVLALWSLSLFYLICVMVGRLDVLHIKSHLRVPSSHRITAQSLLAAAQVGRLAKISYLQP